MPRNCTGSGLGPNIISWVIAIAVSRCPCISALPIAWSYLAPTDASCGIATIGVIGKLPITLASVKETFVNLFNLDCTPHKHSYLVAHHQVGQVKAIDKDYLDCSTLGSLLGIVGKL